MAYNPGVVDRSGEILAQSRMAAGSSLLQGLNQGIETYRKNRLQNQLLTGENDALLAGLQQLQGMQGGAAIANLAPAGMNKLVEKHTQGGGLGLNESMQLNAMLNTTLKTAQAGQQMQAQQINQQIAAQQLQNEIMAGRQAQQDSAGLVNALKELASLEAPSQKDVIGIISRQNLSPKAMGQFTELVGKTSPKGLSVDEMRFMRDQQKADRDSRINARANALALGEPSQALGNATDENEARVLARSLSEKGTQTTPQMRINPATGREEPVNVVTDIRGREVSVTPKGAAVLTPQQQGEATEATEQAKLDVQWNEDFRKSVAGSGTRVAQNKALIDMMRSGRVKMGPTTQAAQAVGRIFASFGGDPKQVQEVADYGLAVNLLSNQLLDYFAKTKGAISDFETKRFIEFAANPAKTNEENIAILEMMVQVEDRNRKALAALKDADLKSAKARRDFLENYVEKNPLDFSKVPQGTYDFTAADAIVRGTKR